MNKDKYIIGLVALVVGFLFGALIFGAFTNKTAGVLGTQVQNETFNFTGGLNAGASNQLSVDGSGNLTDTAGLNQITDLTMNGTVFSLAPNPITTTTATITAAQACNSSLIKFTPGGASATVTFPATSTALFATCLPSVGSIKMFNWNAVGTSTVLAAGAGGTLGYNSSTTIVAGKYAEIRMIRDTANTYLLWVNNITN